MSAAICATIAVTAGHGQSPARPAPAAHAGIESWIASLADPELHPRAAAELLALGSPIAALLATHLHLDAGGTIADRVRDEALLELLVALGPDAADATARLAEALAIGVPRVHVDSLLRAVSAIGPFAAGERATLRVGLERFRATAHTLPVEFFRAVSRLGFDADAAPERLVAGLDDDNVFVRELCAELLSRRRSTAADAVPALERALARHHDSTVRVVGSGWSAALSGDFTRAVHTAAARALVGLAPDAPECAAAHSVLLADADPVVRRDAAMALGRLGPASAAAVPALLRATDDLHLDVAREAVTSLGMIGTPASSAIARLTILSADRDREIAVRARAALRQIRGR